MDNSEGVEIRGLQHLGKQRGEQARPVDYAELTLLYRGAEYSAIIENERIWYLEHGDRDPRLPSGDWTLGMHLKRTPESYIDEVLLEEGVEHFDRLDAALVSCLLTVVAYHGTPPGKWVAVRRGGPGSAI